MINRYNINIRKYHSTDIKNITRLFYDTVHAINAKDYTKKQLDAWTRKDIDEKVWNDSLSSHYSYVAEINHLIVGFGDIDKSGYLDRIFVHKDYQGEGIGTLICDKLENIVKSETIFVHASITSKPFFINRGYNIIKKQEIERNGSVLVNYLMSKKL